LASSLSSSPTTASPEHCNTHKKKKDSDLQSHLMKMIHTYKEIINHSLKKVQGNRVKELEELKEETNKALKVIEERIVVIFQPK
jgi:hypothetical protein